MSSLGTAGDPAARPKEQSVASSDVSFHLFSLFSSILCKFPSFQCVVSETYYNRRTFVEVEQNLVWFELSELLKELKIV